MSTLQQFPELERVRELYIELFRDSSPLHQLGYTRKQIQIVRNSLNLISGSGKVLISKNEPPTLYFVNDIRTYDAQISELREGRGFNLLTSHYPEFAYENVLDRLFASFAYQDIFDIESNTTAMINLLDPSGDVENLEFLIETFYRNQYYGTTRTARKNILSYLGFGLKLLVPYRAEWVDDTKLEFVVEMSFPELGGPPLYYRWRHLTAIRDEHGEVIPFGRKVTTSEEVKEILSKETRVVSGQLSWSSQNV